MNKNSTVILLGLMFAATGAAQAGVATLVSTFGFTDLDTSYDVGTGLYLAQGSTASSGDVTRHDLFSPQTALFAPSEIGNGDSFVEFRMHLDNITGSSADGVSGRVILRDIDGDNMAASFSGTWDFVGGFGFFDGIIFQAQFTGGGDGIFEGTGAGGAFDSPEGMLNGALSLLVQMPDWFDTTNGFTGRSSQGDGILVTPAPAALPLLALGGLVGTRRRRAV